MSTQMYPLKYIRNCREDRLRPALLTKRSSNMKKVIFVLLLLPFCGSIMHSQVRWVKRYDGPVHNLDYAKDVKISANKVYVAGSSWGANTVTDFTIVKYDLISGSQEWAYRYNAPDSGSDDAMSITADSWGYLYATGMVHHSTSSGVDIFTMSITPTGGVRWMKEFTGSGNLPDQGLKIMTDDSRNVYVMGVTTPPSGDFDIIVIKYSELGIELWRRQYESPQIQMPRDMYVDKATGEVFVTGYTGNNFPDYITLKLNASGSIGWVRTFGANLGDISHSIGHDPFSGDILVTGETESIGTGVSITTVRYSSTGDELWSSRYNCPIAGGNSYGLQVESAGDIIYVSGYSNESNTNQSVGLVLGLDSAGTLRWKTTYAARFGNFTSQNIPSDMEVDHYGRAYISARVSDTAFGVGSDIMVVKINQDGFASHFRYNSTFSDGTSALAISNLSVVLTGSSDTTGQSSDMLTAAFPLSAGRFNQTARKVILPFGDAADTMGSVRRIGRYGDATLPLKVTVTLDSITFPATGDLEIYLIHNGITDTLVFHQGGAGDHFISTVLDDTAATPITGGSAPFTGTYRPYKPLAVFNTSNVEGDWILRVKNTGSSTGMLNSWSINFELDENTIGIQQTSTEIPNGYSLGQNYPNPFNPVTKIKFNIPKAGQVSMKLYDITGREAAVLVNKQLSPGSYNYDLNANDMGLSSGVYFYRLITDNFTDVKKLVLVK